MPKPKKPTLTNVERITLVLGFTLLVLGIILAVTRNAEIAPAREVKQQNIPVEAEDFRGDPAVYDAIQKLFGNPERSAPTPQSQAGQQSHDTGNTLQPSATGLQAR